MLLCCALRFLVISILVFLASASNGQNAAFEIIDIGIVSTECEGEWQEKMDCSEKAVNQYILQKMEWGAMDSTVAGKHRVTLRFEVASDGTMTSVTASTDSPELLKACKNLGKNWPMTFKYLREDGLSIMGSYSSVFSFYF